MKTVGKLILLMVVVMNLSGCYYAAITATGIVQEQTASDETKQNRMRRIVGPGSVEVVDLTQRVGDKKVSVGAFTSNDPGRKTYLCRLGALISPPRDMTYEEFFRDELIKQLKADRVYDAHSPVVLSGKIEELDFSSTSDYWKTTLKVTSSNGKSLEVVNKYEYNVSFWGGEIACDVAKKEMPFAVRNTIEKLVREWDFPKLFAPPATTVGASVDAGRNKEVLK